MGLLKLYGINIMNSKENIKMVSEGFIIFPTATRVKKEPIQAASKVVGFFCLWSNLKLPLPVERKLDEKGRRAESRKKIRKNKNQDRRLTCDDTSLGTGF